jgi:hypothetical protein
MRVLSVVFLAVAIAATAPPAAAQDAARTVTLTVDAPVFPGPSTDQAPLRIGKAGSVLRLVSVNGDWCQVEFNDPERGRRTGYVQTKNLQLSETDAAPSFVPSAGSAAQIVNASAPSGLLDARGDIAAGYSVLPLWIDGKNKTLPLGWFVSSSARVTKGLAIAGEASGHYDSTSSSGANLRGDVYSLAAGPRVLFGNARALGFVQLLVGSAHFAAGEGGSGNNRWAFLWNTGGGVDVSMTSKLALRTQLDYQFFTAEGDTQHGLRFGVGISIPFR